MRYFFLVEYNGANYGGWQRQTNATSIQETLERAFTIALRKPIVVHGAGRTDAGVHARAMGAHIDCDTPPDARRLVLSVNALLPRDIAISDFRPVSGAFDARFSARRRWYGYYMVTRKEPLRAGQAWMLFYELDWSKMRDEMEALRGRHDFSAFCASGSNAVSKECTVEQVTLQTKGALIKFTIAADRFIYTMVRSIVGTLVDIGRGKITEPLATILASKNRRRAGETAPACGLFLERVEYTHEIEQR